LGNGTNDASNVPVRVLTTDVSGTKWTSFASFNANTSQGRRDDGSLWQWGILNAGTSNVPVRVLSTDVSGTKWISGSSSFQHSLGLRDDGSLYAWGRNIEGELGNGTNIETFDVPVRVIGVGNTTGTALSVTTYNYNTPTNQWLNDISDQLIDASGTALAVAVNAAGTRLAVGAPGAEAGKGAVFLYDLSSNNQWTLRVTPDISSNVVGGGFGNAVAFDTDGSGTNLVVGAPGAGAGAGGHVYKYTDTSGNGAWSLTRDLSAAGAGTSVAYSGATIFTGAPTALPTNKVYILLDYQLNNNVLATSMDGREWTTVDNSSENLFYQNNKNLALTVVTRKPLPNLGGKNTKNTPTTYSSADNDLTISTANAWVNTDLVVTVPYKGLWLIEGSIEFNDGFGNQNIGIGLAFTPALSSAINLQNINYTTFLPTQRPIHYVVNISQKTTVTLQVLTTDSVVMQNRYLSLTQL
jgi:hypothetical protein